MTVQPYQFARRRETAVEAQVSPVPDLEDLPVIGPDLLPQFFARLSNEDKIQLLRYKILPVACLPNTTLYAAAGHWAREAAVSAGHKVVASVAPADLMFAIRRKLGPEILARATHSLRRLRPELSAHQRITPDQALWMGIVTFLALAGIWILPAGFMFGVLSFFCGVFFLSVISLRLLCILENGGGQTPQALQLSDSELPTYTVLVPVFRETRVLAQLVQALQRLNYPTHKLDIKIILEETDTPMQRAIAQLKLPEQFDVIVVPAGKPQTKPRALNYALQFARGSLLTIYDAEDIPEPMQLRKAAAQFAAASPKVACLQAELTFYNPNENWLTRQFTVEYAILFKLIMPALATENLPVLLGGTSNHFRISLLRSIGAWDPFNVTEDADLGLRLARAGYKTAVLDSVTYEEANPALWNWMQQRSRWLKGFLQTWLVHMRKPLSLYEELGAGGMWCMQAMTLGLIISALFHPLLLGHAIYMMMSGQLFVGNATAGFRIVAGLNLSVLIAGYGFSAYAGFKALRRKHVRGWWFTLLTMPAYWMLLTVAGWMAVWQFILQPFHWNKTRHGLSRFQRTGN